MDQNIIFFGIWILLIVVHVIFSRTRYFNAPENVLVEYDDYVIVRTNKITWLFGGNRIKLAKQDIKKIQLDKTCLSFFNETRSVKDVWVAKSFAKETFERAKQLFPDAKAVWVDEQSSI